MSLPVRISCLILHYNNPDALCRSVEGFLSFGFHAESISVLDNRSADEHRARLRQLESHYGFELVASSENHGWGGAINWYLGRREWQPGEILCIAAHDAVLQRFDHTVVSEAFADERVLFLSPQYHVPWECHYSISRGFWSHPVGPRNIAREGPPPTSAVKIAHATLLFARPKPLAALRYDENLFIYGCESEIFLRAADAGFKTLMTDGIIVGNTGTDTSSRFRTLAFTINSLYLAKKMGGSAGYLQRLFIAVLSVARVGLAGRLNEARWKARAILFSIGSGGAGFRQYRETDDNL